ncbi:MAG: hypothetical protein AB7F43_07030 [Bacteriovoracia bacterium]
MRTKVRSRNGGGVGVVPALELGLRKPSDVFSSCPQCESPNIYKFEGDAFCTYCDWDSIILRVDARFAARDALRFSEDEDSREKENTRQVEELLGESPFLSIAPCVA